MKVAFKNNQLSIHNAYIYTLECQNKIARKKNNSLKSQAKVIVIIKVKSQRMQCSLNEISTCDKFSFERNQFCHGGIDPIT